MVLHVLQLEKDQHLAKIFRWALQNVQPYLRLTQFGDPADLLTFLSHTTGATKIDIFLLDLHISATEMDMNILQHVRRLYPQTKLILTSRFGAPNAALLAEPHVHFIPKPWQMTALLELLMEVPASTKSEPVSGNGYGTPIVLGFGTRGGQRARAINSKAQGRFERVIRRFCDHLLESFGVSAVAILIAERSSNKVNITSRLFQPDLWQASVPEELITHLTETVLQRGQPVLLEDVRLLDLTSADGRVIRNIGAACGISFAGPAPEEVGLLFCFGTEERTWVEADASALSTAAAVVQELFRLGDAIDDLTERLDELSDYTNTIAQEMKLPLATIITHTDSLKDVHNRYAESVVPGMLGEDILKNILFAADGIGGMITQLLWLARLDRPLDTVHAIDVNAVVLAALARIEQVIKIRGIEVEIEPKLPRALGPDIWMEEVFANFISNAVKFMGDDNPAPKIRIVGSRHGHYARYEVHDNGVGILQEHIPLLFEKFTRFGSGRSTAVGSGLGLAIVQRIVRRLGGKVGVESEIGKGSIFWFTLPSAGSSA
ncbi:MAG: HAMP domain-containing histidine kinase [Anaerolineae bacterium]|nr:HAMP domain-containing histidine kinase [Anaerolineae bacterium]